MQSGPGPAKGKRSDKKPSSSAGAPRTGPVLFFQGDTVKLYAVKDASGAEPASLTYLYCGGEDGGALETDLPSD